MSYNINPLYEKKLKQFYKGILEDIKTFVDKNKQFLSTYSKNGNERSLVYYLTAFARLFNDARIDESTKSELHDKMTRLSIMVLRQIDKKTILINPINSNVLNSIEMSDFIQRLKDTSGGKTRRLYKKGRKGKIRKASRRHKSKKNKKKYKKQLGGANNCNIGDDCRLCMETMKADEELTTLHEVTEADGTISPHKFHKHCIRSLRLLTNNNRRLECPCCFTEIPLNEEENNFTIRLQEYAAILAIENSNNLDSIIQYHIDYGVLRYYTPTEIQELRQTHGDAGVVDIIERRLASNRSMFKWLMCISSIIILALYFNGQFR